MGVTSPPSAGVKLSPVPAAPTPSSEAVPRPSRRSTTAMASAPSPFARWRSIALGYVLVVAFLAVFVGTLLVAGRSIDALGEPRWALLVATLLVLPAIGPTIARTVGPRLRSIKIGDFAEVELAGAEARSASLDALLAQTPLSGEVSAPEYAGMMSSMSIAITETVQRLELTGEEVLVVDLAAGNAWVLPNLYLLALLVRRRTAVRQLAFMETRRVPGVFVCACAPGDLVAAVERTHPVLRQAASQLTYDQLMTPGPMAGTAFFGALSQLYGQTASNLQVKDLWVTPAILFALLGEAAHVDAIVWSGALADRDAATILRSDDAYVAAVDPDGALEFLLSRDRLALTVARAVSRKSD